MIRIVFDNQQHPLVAVAPAAHGLEGIEQPAGRLGQPPVLAPARVAPADSGDLRKPYPARAAQLLRDAAYSADDFEIGRKTPHAWPRAQRSAHAGGPEIRPVIVHAHQPVNYRRNSAGSPSDRSSWSTLGAVTPAPFAG